MCAPQYAQNLVAHGGHALVRKLGKGLRSSVNKGSLKPELAHGRQRGLELRAQHVHVRRRGDLGLVEPARALRVRVSSVLPDGVRWAVDKLCRVLIAALMTPVTQESAAIALVPPQSPVSPPIRERGRCQSSSVAWAKYHLQERREFSRPAPFLAHPKIVWPSIPLPSPTRLGARGR